jgi:hypothetical protein
MHRTAFEFPPEVDEFEGTIHEHVVFGEVLRFHVRDDLYLARGRIDIGALAAVGRLAAEYTLVTSIFTPPLDGETLDQRNGQRMVRLDGQPDGWSPIDSNQWSRSGSTMSEPAKPSR